MGGAIFTGSQCALGMAEDWERETRWGEEHLRPIFLALPPSAQSQHVTEAEWVRR